MTTVTHTEELMVVGAATFDSSGYYKGPLVQRIGRSFLDYNERADVKDSKLNVQKIMSSWDVLAASMATGGLCISRSTCTKVLELIYAKLEHAPNVRMKDEHYTGWVVVMSRRLYNTTLTIHIQI